MERCLTQTGTVVVEEDLWDLQEVDLQSGPLVVAAPKTAES